MAKTAKTKINELVDAVKHVLEALRDQPRNAWMISSRADEAIKMLDEINEEPKDGGND